MQIIKRVKSRGYYIFESKSAGNSNYIESIEEAKRLMVYANYFLKDYLKIHDYIITRHGWQFVVRLNNEKSIISTVCTRKYDVKNGLKGLGDDQVWKIISERIRLFISCYVRQVNHLRGRSGVLVHSNYTRYHFENIDEALGHLEKIRNQQVRLYQRRKRYRGLKIHYRISKKMGKGSVFLCSKEMKKGGVESLGMEVYQQLSDLVLPNLIDFTKKSHFSPPIKPKPMFHP